MTDAVVDLGKTRCRLRLTSTDSNAGERARSGVPADLQAETGGTPGLGTADGVVQATDSILAALSRLPGPHAQVRRLAVGAAGALAAPTASLALAQALRSHLGCDSVAVTSDAVTAHLGALAGGPGVVVVAGTGAVAVALNEHGRIAVTDGAGPADGDRGSGGWIGRAALALAAAGRPGWAELAAHRLGPDWTSIATDVSFAAATRHGSLVPDVVARARQGDADAVALIEQAATALASTALAAAGQVGGTTRIAVVGGLTNIGDLLLGPLARAVAPARLRHPQGSALDGAALLLARHDLPHEPAVTRLG